MSTLNGSLGEVFERDESRLLMRNPGRIRLMSLVPGAAPKPLGGVTFTMQIPSARAWTQNSACDLFAGHVIGMDPCPGVVLFGATRQTPSSSTLTVNVELFATTPLSERT